MSAGSEITDRCATIYGGTIATNVFEGQLPDKPDAAMAVLPSPGAATVRVFGGVAWEVRRYQLFVRGTYAGAEAKAETLWAALDAIANESIGGTFYRSITCLQPPYLFERDTTERVTWAFNIETERVAP